MIQTKNRIQVMMIKRDPSMNFQRLSLALKQIHH